MRSALRVGSRVFFSPVTSDKKAYQTLQEIWSLIGFDKEITEVFLRYRVLFFNRLFTVDASFENDPQALPEIKEALIAAWKLIGFSTGWWLSTQPSSKALLGAELSGLKDLGEFLRADETESTYYLHKYWELTDETRDIVVACALGSGVCEGVQLLLLKDGRVLKRMPELHEIVNEEVHDVYEITNAAFEVLAGLTASNAMMLRTIVTSTMHCSLSFVDECIFRRSKEGIWGLCENKRQSLLDLEAGPEPLEDENLYQLWRLMHAKYHLEGLVEVLDEVENLDWTSGVTEKKLTSQALRISGSIRMLSERRCRTKQRSIA